MALPSAVSLGSLAFVVVAGVGLVFVATSSGEEAAPAAASGPTTQSPADEAPDRQRPDRPDRHKPDREPADIVPKTLVDVYNNSGVSGLAAEQAEFLQGAGWNVAATDNWYGDIPDNTVYFPPKLKGEASQLADALGYARLRPAVAPMQFDRLTVIITSAS